MEENSVAKIEKGADDFRVHELPYTTSEEKLLKWAKYSILHCYAKSRNVSNIFDGDIRSTTAGAGYLSFIQKMLTIYEGTYKATDIDFLTKEGANNDMELPARLINYPLLKNNFDIITGQFIQTNIDLAVASVAPDAIDKKLNKRAELMFNKLVGDHIKATEESTGVKLEHSMPIVDDEDKYITLTYKQMEELNMSRLLKVSYYKHAWNDTFRKNILYQLLLGFFAYKIIEKNGDEIKLRAIKPRNAIFDWDCEDDFGDDMMYFGEERYMNLNGIMSEFKPKEDVLKKIKADFQSTIENGGQSGPSTGYSNSGDNGIRVIDMVWGVTRKQRVKIVDNKYNPTKKIVKYLNNGEKGTIGKNETGEIKDVEIFTWYQGALVGNHVVQFGECKDMGISYQNPAVIPNDFVIGLYNRVLKKPNGMMASVAPLQELWNELMFKLELEIATSPGNIVEYDATAKPDDMEYTDVFYYLKAKKLLITKKPGSSRSIDMGLASVQHILTILMYVEMLADTLTGTNKFKKAQVSGETAVGTMQSAIAQADLILEAPFQFHREAIKRVFKKAAGKLKMLNQYEGEKPKYIMGTTGFQYFKIQQTVPTEEYDIFFIDGTMQAKKKELLMKLAETGFSAGQASMEQMIAIVKHDDVNEVYAELGRLIELNKKIQTDSEKIKNQIEAAKTQLPMELESLKAQVEEMKKKYDHEIAQLYVDGPIKKEVVVNEIKKNNPEQ